VIEKFWFVIVDLKFICCAKNDFGVCPDSIFWKPTINHQMTITVWVSALSKTGLIWVQLTFSLQ